MTTNSFADLKHTPEMVARSAARNLLDMAYKQVATGSRRDPAPLLRTLSVAGRGRSLLEKQPDFKAALWLLT